MLTIVLDPTSSLSVRWPKSHRTIVALGEAYVAHEGSLAPEAQLKDVPLTVIQTALDEAKAAMSAALSGEQGRASAGELVQQTFTALEPLLEKAFIQLKAKHFDHLALLEQWGLDTAVSRGKVQVRKPSKNQQQQLAFLQAYVAKEASLPPEEQLSDPPLATMQAHLANLQTNLAERTSGRDQREVNVEVRNTAVARLLTLLKTAAMIRVMATFNGVLTNELQLWGFQVVARATNGSSSQEDVKVGEG